MKSENVFEFSAFFLKPRSEPQLLVKIVVSK
jgi:hypothetical protein